MIKIKANAKINLTLKILGSRPDGFHELESIMQNVSVFDIISLEKISSGIIIESEDAIMPTDEKNICYKAASLVLTKHNISEGVRIIIEKNIPMQAGMGGGSADAAATLVGLNKLFELNLDDMTLLDHAAKLGSDVPFFLIGGRALCKGRGEKVEKIKDQKSKIKNKEEYYIIVKPDVSVPTKWAYEQFDKLQIKNQRSNIKNEDGEYFNDLQGVVVERFPVIGQIIDDLLKSGCSAAQMTGSGSAVFGVVHDKDKAEKIFDTIKDLYAQKTAYRIFLSKNEAASFS